MEKSIGPLDRLAFALEVIDQGDASKEQVLLALAFKQQLYEAYRSITHRFDQAMIGWIEANGDLEDGDKRWYVGTATTRKCRFAGPAFKALLEANGGDLDATLAALCSDPFKPALASDMLGDKADQHFDTVTTLDLKTGKPKKTLKSFDKRFGPK